MPRKKKIWRAGLKLIAEAMSNEFHRIITKQLVHSWKAWNPPFPAPHQNNQYDQEECFEWYRTHPKTQGQTQSELSLVDQAYQAKQELTIRENEREQFEFDVLKKKYIDRGHAERQIVGFAKRYHSWVRREVENYTITHRIEHLKSLKLTPEQLASFQIFDTTESERLINQIEDRCESFCKESTGNLTK